jgi:uncharacterized protein YndB with AHSA1/START domain
MTAVNTSSTNADAISVTADTKNGVIRGTAEINAPPERVFRALTTEEMSEWWGHEGVYRTMDYKIDLRPGGRWGCRAVGADGSESTVGGEYITVDPPRVLEYTWEPSWDNFAVSRVRIEITPMGAGSRISILHTGFEGREQMAENHRDGWTRVFGWLAEYLAGK